MTREEGLQFIGKSIKNDVDMAMVADAIEALSAEPQKMGWWIPVSERLPGYGERYCVGQLTMPLRWVIVITNGVKMFGLLESLQAARLGLTHGCPFQSRIGQKVRTE